MLLLAERLIKIDPLIDLFERDLHIHAFKDQFLPGLIAEMAPEGRLTLVTSVDFNVRGELADQHNFLNAGAGLIGSELLCAVVFIG